jgi:hypothetical protein
MRTTWATLLIRTPLRKEKGEKSFVDDNIASVCCCKQGDLFACCQNCSGFTSDRSPCVLHIPGGGRSVRGERRMLDIAAQDAWTGDCGMMVSAG